ncbi:MAG: hypothetical protein HY903_22245 [Deltaproteobacteria bacterium]|nr:hypothetical protein [Deltaproteobacteria bacterium]
MSRRSEAPPLLFTDGRLDDWLRVQKGNIVTYINGLSRDQFLGNSDDDLVEHVVSKFDVAPLELHQDRATMAARECVTEVDDYDRVVRVPANCVTVRVPFSGLPELWNLRPSTFDFNPPRANVEAQAVVFEWTIRTGDNQNLKPRLEGVVRTLQEWIGRQKADLTRYQQELPGFVRQAIVERRQRLQAQEGLLKSLDLPLERNAGMPDFRHVPLERAIKPLAPAPAGGYRQEPTLSQERFEDILSIIRHQGRTFETTPASYSALGEEALRDILLAALNAVYLGKATGETFRKRGKTDIRIEADDRSAFVAECKLWKGSAYLVGGMEQLLGYLTWRDGKAAMVILIPP